MLTKKRIEAAIHQLEHTLDKNLPIDSHTNRDAISALRLADKLLGEPSGGMEQAVSMALVLDPQSKTKVSMVKRMYENITSQAIKEIEEESK